MIGSLAPIPVPRYPDSTVCAHYCSRKLPHIITTIGKRTAPFMSPSCLLPLHYTHLINSNNSDNNTWVLDQAQVNVSKHHWLYDLIEHTTACISRKYASATFVMWYPAIPVATGCSNSEGHPGRPDLICCCTSPVDIGLRGVIVRRLPMGCAWGAQGVSVGCPWAVFGCLRAVRGKPMNCPWAARGVCVRGKSHTRGGLMLGSAWRGFGGARPAVVSWKSQSIIKWKYLLSYHRASYNIYRAEKHDWTWASSTRIGPGIK